MIEILNTETRAFKHLPDLQAVANFLAEAPDAGDWTGWEGISAVLPTPTVNVPVVEPEAQVQVDEPAAVSADLAAASAENAIKSEFVVIGAAFDELPAAKAAAKKAPAKKSAKRK